MVDLSGVKYDSNGLVVAIAQDITTGCVVMQAYMNEEALKLTLETGLATYYSRSRKKLWVKGETSGNEQRVEGVYLDCDGDSILVKVRQNGVACHTGHYSCFHNPLKDGGSLTGAAAITEDYNIIMDRVANPQSGSYTNYLFDKGVDKMCKKVGEEAAEVIIAAKNDSPEELRCEAADLVYHTLVLMAKVGLTPEELYGELESRRK